MTHLSNEPSNFVAEALSGFVRAHKRYVRQVDGGVVRANPIDEGQVAVIVGGGSGHYPAFAGVVGSGFAAAAVCGNIFSSPSAGQAHRVARAAERGGGVIFTYGNYAGDVLHFGLAQEKLRAEGFDVRTVLVTDDIASASRGEEGRRRGIAGDFPVFKIMSAAAERGDSIDEVERLARKANDRTRTLGAAFGGCTLPGANEPLFTVPEGEMSVGLGIHGEPGISDQAIPRADDLARILLGELLDDRPAAVASVPGQRVAVIVNGLGAVKYEELFVLFNAVAHQLADAGATIIEPEVGELVTSLDMAGVSVTLVWLDAELEELWRAPADTPAYRKTDFGDSDVPDVDFIADFTAERIEREVFAESDEYVIAVEPALHLLHVARQTVVENEQLLGAIDAYAGDGDHSVGMVLGLTAALEEGEHLASRGGGIAGVLTAAGDAWSERAGGTSGALWGAALISLGSALREAGEITPDTLTRAVERALATMQNLGGAQVGDKTLVDAFVPYARTLREQVDNGTPFDQALDIAATTAQEAADATATLRPRLGRARPLAEKSVGHPDAGAISFALLARALADAATTERAPR